MDAQVDQIRFRPGALLPDILDRTDPADPPDDAPSATALASRTVQRMLDQYVALLHLGLSSVQLTMDEARLLLALHSSFPFHELDGRQLREAIAYLPGRVRNGLADPPVDVSAINAPQFLKNVEDWTTLQRAAVLDALHRAWIRAGRASESVEALLVIVGLVRQP